jgi:hypothetical protein
MLLIRLCTLASLDRLLEPAIAPSVRVLQVRSRRVRVTLARIAPIYIRIQGGCSRKDCMERIEKA